MNTSCLRALLAGSVDYAGLFPPAGLALGPALENYNSYLRGDHAWLLGCLVLPTSKLADTEPLLAGRFGSDCPLRISGLGSKASTAAEFLENLRANLGELARFGQTYARETVIEQFEAPFPSSVADPVRVLLEQSAELIETVVPWPLHVFWEVPFGENLPVLLRRFAQHNEESQQTSRRRPFGVKFRTGGLEAAAFPSPGQLATMLLAARDAGVALKFTAGLHYPVRHYSEALGTWMHGFLNVFAAGVIAREHPLDVMETQAILEDEDLNSFRFDSRGFAWRERHVPAAALPAHRQFVTSFGSCSFDEPCDDLRRLGLML